MPPNSSQGEPPFPSAPPPGSTPARPFGAPRNAAVPRMEHVRVTAPDLARRAALELSRSRLVIAAGGFAALFLAVTFKLAWATLLHPMLPKEPAVVVPTVAQPQPEQIAAQATPHRASIVDRNGQVLAVSLVTAEVYADPRQMIDTADAAHRLRQVLPEIDEADLAHRLASAKQFVYVARRITPRQELAINNLGIPGVSFAPSERRQYPQGRVAAQVLGGVDVDSNGVAGVEKFFDRRLATNAAPLRLSLDLRVQAVVRDELQSAMTEFTAIGAAGIVMDVNSGEILAMVSLPDYDANDFGNAPAVDRFNRAVTGRYEPGSTFKLQTAAMALDGGVAHIWNEFDAAHDIHVGRFTISDFKGQHRFLYLPEVLAYSSNLGAAHIAQAVGAERQRAWLGRMGMFQPVGVELPEAARPIVPSVSRWSFLTTMTVGFGHGIAVTPLHVVRGTAALANGGHVLRPTLLAHDAPGTDAVAADELAIDGEPGATLAATEVSDPAPAPSAADAMLAGPMDNRAADRNMPPEPAMPPPVALGKTVMKPETGDIVRRLMRLVVTNGYGKPAEVNGYYVGGKTGTAEKVGAGGGYEKHANVSAFICVFPMYHPRYAVYMMLDEPHGNASTGFYSTAGAVSAPAAGKVIARIAPMLGMFPELADAERINASLYIPMQPVRPAGASATVEEPAAQQLVNRAASGERRGHTEVSEPRTAHPAAQLRRTAYVGAPIPGPAAIRDGGRGAVR